MHIPMHNLAGLRKNNRNLLRGIVERILAVRENLVLRAHFSMLMPDVGLSGTWQP